MMLNYQNSFKSDWEVELAFVIGKKTKNVTEVEAMDYVSGIQFVMMCLKENGN